jgi:NitT/TauT family transport system substrate-binding protein
MGIRRQFPLIAAVGILATLAGACRRTSAPAPMRIRYADLINVDVRDVPLLMAFDELAKQGYTIEKVYLSSSAEITDLLARGDAEIAMVNNQTVWTAVAKGADLRTIGPFTATTTVMAVADAIHSCQDLDGKSIGVANSAGLSPLLLNTYLSRHCPSAQPPLIVIPESGARANALLTGRVQATLLPGEELLKLQRQSHAPLRTLYTQAAEFPEIQIEGLHVRREWAAQHGTALRDFLRAQLVAYRRVIDHPQVLFEESITRLKIDADTAKAIGTSHLDMHIWDGNGLLTTDNIQSTIDFLVKAHVLPDGTRSSQVADFSYMNAVLDEIGRVH